MRRDGAEKKALKFSSESRVTVLKLKAKVSRLNFTKYQ